MSNGVQTDWLDSATATYLPKEGGGGVFGPKASPVVVEADVGTGSVEVQMQDSTGTWVTPTEGLIEDADAIVVVDVENLFGIRIIAVGDAEYRVNWSG